MRRISTDADYLRDGTVRIDADGIPLEWSSKADTAYVDAQDQSLGKRITDEKWVRPPLPNGTDLDTARTSGMHPITTSASMLTMTNRPAGASGTGALVVRNVQNTIFQELWWWSSTGRKTAYRTTTGGVFGSWTAGVESKAEAKHEHAFKDIPGLQEALDAASGTGSWVRPPLPNGTDLDTVRTSGLHPVTSSVSMQSMLNRPPVTGMGTGALIVYNVENTIFQELVWWSSGGATKSAKRVTTGGVFNPWDMGGADTGSPTPGSAVISPREKYFTVDGRLAPVLTDTTRITGWGSSSLGNMAVEFRDVATTLGATYYNGARGGEKIQHIAARMGAVPAIINPVTIPASGAVAVTSPNLPPEINMLAFTGWLGGVHGTLSSTSSQLTFTRTSPGDAVTLGGPEELVTDIDASLWETVTIISAGKNNATDADAVELVLDYTARMVRHLTPLFPRFIVMGHYFNQDWVPGDVRRDRMAEINQALAETYGDFFVDHQGILTDPGVWEKAGLSPTQGDLDAQEELRLPPSLAADKAHQNAAADLVVTDTVRQRMVDLGWY